MFVIEFDYYIKSYNGLLIKTVEDFNRNYKKAVAFLIKTYPHIRNINVSDDEEKSNLDMCLIELTEYFYKMEYTGGVDTTTENGEKIKVLSTKQQNTQKTEIIKQYIPSKYLYLGGC